MRRVLFLVGLLVALGVLVAGCGGNAQSEAPAASAAGMAAAAPTAGGPAGMAAVVSPTAEGVAEPVLASSELLAGPSQRFVLGMLDTNTGAPVKDVPEVSVQFFKVHDDGTAIKMGDATTIYHSENLPTGLFVARTNFSEPGKWGALVTVKRQGKDPYQAKLNFDVVTRGASPIPGDPAPLSKNDTTANATLDQICSAVPHDDMHDLTIADAVKSGKPALILFAAPGYCASYTCGPDLEMVQKLEEKYRGKANFIHIETPSSLDDGDHAHSDSATPDPNTHLDVEKPQVAVFNEWGLKTDPWVFIVDKGGKISDRFEGGLTIDEVEPALRKVIK